MRADRVRPGVQDTGPAEEAAFTGAIIVLFRFGANLPAPGISEPNGRYCSHLESVSGSSGVFAILNLLSGNSLLHLTVFALGILPYITASIILQLLTQVIPRLETLKKDGQAGQATITQYTRYVTVGLGVLQSVAYVATARSHQGWLIPQPRDGATFVIELPAADGQLRDLMISSARLSPAGLVSLVSAHLRI